MRREQEPNKDIDQALQHYEEEIRKLFLSDFYTFNNLTTTLIIAGLGYVIGIPKEETASLGKVLLKFDLPTLDEQLIINQGNTLESYLVALHTYLKNVLDTYLRPRLKVLITMCKKTDEPFAVSPLLTINQKKLCLLKVKIELIEEVSENALFDLLAQWEAEVDPDIAAEN